VTTTPARYDDLRALFLNCTLTPSPATSHTQLLMDRSIGLMRDLGVSVDVARVVDHVVPPGVQTDMTEHGVERDDWPALQQRVLDADVLVLGTPIWLGDKSSVCTRVVERLYGFSGQTNDRGSTSTTAGSGASWSPATRTASSTSP
jgi:multimeric flavodoxin WrbA